MTVDLVFHLINITSVYEHDRMIQQHQGPYGSTPNRKTEVIASQQMNQTPDLGHLEKHPFCTKLSRLRVALIMTTYAKAATCFSSVK